MKKRNSFIFVFLFLLLSCGHRVVTMQTFSDIPLGATQTEVKEIAGKPVQIKKIGNNMEEYIYIERLYANGMTQEERHYVIRFRNGRVCGKDLRQESPSPFQRDGIDIQTSSTN